MMYHTIGSIVPLLRLAVGTTAAVDEARHIALGAGINDEAGGQLHHVEVGLPRLLGNLHALLAHTISDHLPCRTVPNMRVSTHQIMTHLCI